MDSRESVYSDISYSGNIQKDALSEFRQAEVVRRLKKLIKCRDFFVTPAAVAALCEICQNGSRTLPIPVIDADALPT
jgi:hypothetical protein